MSSKGGRPQGSYKNKRECDIDKKKDRLRRMISKIVDDLGHLNLENLSDPHALLQYVPGEKNENAVRFLKDARSLPYQKVMFHSLKDAAVTKVEARRIVAHITHFFCIQHFGSPKASRYHGRTCLKNSVLNWHDEQFEFLAEYSAEDTFESPSELSAQQPSTSSTPAPPNRLHSSSSALIDQLSSLRPRIRQPNRYVAGVQFQFSLYDNVFSVEEIGGNVIHWNSLRKISPISDRVAFAVAKLIKRKVFQNKNDQGAKHIVINNRAMQEKEKAQDVNDRLQEDKEEIDVGSMQLFEMCPDFLPTKESLDLTECSLYMISFGYVHAWLTIVSFHENLIKFSDSCMGHLHQHVRDSYYETLIEMLNSRYGFRNWVVKDIHSQKQGMNQCVIMSLFNMEVIMKGDEHNDLANLNPKAAPDYRLDFAKTLLKTTKEGLLILDRYNSDIKKIQSEIKVFTKMVL